LKSLSDFWLLVRLQNVKETYTHKRLLLSLTRSLQAIRLSARPVALGRVNMPCQLLFCTNISRKLKIKSNEIIDDGLWVKVGVWHCNTCIVSELLAMTWMSVCFKWFVA